MMILQSIEEQNHSPQLSFGMNAKWNWKIVTLNFAIALPEIGEVENLTAEKKVCKMCFPLFQFPFPFQFVFTLCGVC